MVRTRYPQRPAGRREAVVSANGLVVAALLVFSLACLDAGAQTVPGGFSISTVVDGVGTDVVGFTFLPDGRILLIRKEAGTVSVVVDGALGNQPLMTVSRLKRDSERGLLGIAVDPDFPDSNYVYLYYTRDDTTNRVERFSATGALSDPTSADISLDSESVLTLMTFPDSTRFHNAGTLRFGSDKTLFISHGDDAYADLVQSLSVAYGKIFRIHRDGSVPTDNPSFPGAPPDALPETYAFGLRNPFRFSIDPENGALFIGDVGTNLYEEFDVSFGGENFGYPHFEGPDTFRPWIPLLAPEPTPPIYFYPYNRAAGAASAIALAAYRPVGYPDDASFPPEYDGAYFHTDFFDDELRYLLQDGTGTWVSHDFASGFSRLVDGRVAPDGSLYVLEFGGALFRIAYGEGSGVATEETVGPTEVELRQSYPNPADASTTIEFAVPTLTDVTLTVLDLLGRRVATPLNGRVGPGQHRVEVGTARLPTGFYLYRLEAGDRVITRSLLVVR